LRRDLERFAVEDKLRGGRCFVASLVSSQIDEFPIKSDEERIEKVQQDEPPDIP
jgi:hypothetical protein